jgi:hypothetical protein
MLSSRNLKIVTITVFSYSEQTKNILDLYSLEVLCKVFAFGI